MEDRVAKLEIRMESVDKRLSAIELLLAEIKGTLSQMPKATDLAVIRAEIGEIKGKISNLPTNWTFFIGLIGLCGFMLTVLKFVKM